MNASSLIADPLPHRKSATPRPRRAVVPASLSASFLAWIAFICTWVSPGPLQAQTINYDHIQYFQEPPDSRRDISGIVWVTPTTWPNPPSPGISISPDLQRPPIWGDTGTWTGSHTGSRGWVTSTQGYTGGEDISETTAAAGSAGCDTCVTCDTPGPDPKILTLDGDPTGVPGTDFQERPPSWAGSAGGAGGGGGGGTGGALGKFGPNAESKINVPINLGRSNNPNGTLAPVMQAQIIFRGGDLDTDAASIKNMKSPADIGGDLRWYTYGDQACVRQWLGNGCLADVQPINIDNLDAGTRIRLYTYATTPSVASGLYSTAGLTEFRRVDIYRSTAAGVQLIVENWESGIITRDWIYTRTESAPHYHWSLAERVRIDGTLKKVREQLVVQNGGATVRTHLELAGFTGNPPTTPILATTSVTRTTYTTFTLADGSKRRRPTQRIRYQDKAGSIPVSRIDWTYYNTDVAHAASYGRAKTRRDYIYNPNGTNYLSFWEDYSYTRPVGSSVQTTTIYRSWHGSPVANYSQALKITRVEMPLPTVSGMNRLDFPERYIVQTLSLGSQTLSYVANVVTASTTDITVTQTVAADANNCTIVRKYYGVSEDAHKRFRLKEILYPDNTLTAYDYESLGGGTVEHTVKSGWRTGGGDSFHTKVESTYNRQGFQMEHAVTDVSSGLLTSSWKVSLTDVDAHGRPTKITYNGNSSEYATWTYGCCGLEQSRDTDGRVTKYEQDVLKRPTSVTEFFGTSAAIETTYSYARRMSGETELGGTVITRTRGGAAVNITKRDTAGRVIEVLTPDADGINVGAMEPTTIAYETLTDGKLKVTETRPISDTENTSSSTITYGDGSLYEVSGPAVADTRYEYGTWSIGSASRYGLTVARIALSSGGATTERGTSYTDLAGRVVLSRQSLGASDFADTVSVYSTTTNQLLRQVDPDGVTTLYAYNARGERFRSAVDRDGNNQIDLATDRVTESETTVVDDIAEGQDPPELVRVGISFMTESRVYFTSDTPTIVSTSWTAANGRSGRTEAQGAKTGWKEERFGGDANPATGTWSSTTTHADGTASVSKYELWRPKREEFLNKSSSVVSWSEVTNYDTLHRADKFKQSRNNQETELTFFANGNVQTEKNVSANETTMYVRDRLGRVKEIQLPGGAGTQHKSYTAAGQIFKEWGKLSYPVRYTYDEQGRMKTMDTFRGLSPDTQPEDTGGSPDTTTWNYNAYSGRLYEKVHADGKKTQYTHTKAGRVHTRTWARSSGSVVTTYKYALANAVTGDDTAVSTIYGGLTKVDYSDSTPDVTYVHDRLGRPTSITDALGTRTFDYVANKFQLWKENYPSSFPGTSGASIHRLYQTQDLDNNKAANRYEGFQVQFNDNIQFTNTYAYDNAGRLEKVSDAGGVIGTYAYVTNSASLVQSLTRQTGTGGALVENRTWFPYHDRLDIINNTLAGATTTKYDYAVNALGQRTAVTATGSTFSSITPPSWSVFSYNAHGEVTGATHASDSTRNRSYIFDSIGNRKNSRNGTDPAVGYLVDASNSTNKYTKLFDDQNNNGMQNSGENNTATFAHDDDGNMTDDGGSGAAGRTFVWDAENRLIEVWNKAATPKKLATYTYDYKSRRVKKQTTADAPQGATHIAYLYDGWNVIAEYDLTAGNPSASPVKRHDWGLDLSGSIQGAGGVGGLIRTHLNSLTYFPCYDGNGNLTELRLASTGGFAAQYQYDPFGREIISSGLVSSHNFYRFSTKPFDRETEFYYYGYRYYNPVLGRWLNRDPIGEEGGKNLFGILENEPLNKIDVLGLVDSISAMFRACMALPSPQARKECLENLIDILSGGCPYKITSALAKLKAIKGIRKIAEKMGRSEDEIRDAIHKVKRDNMSKGKSKGGKKENNRDVRVDPDSGEVFPEIPGGKPSDQDAGLGDSIGNIFEYLD